MMFWSDQYCEAVKHLHDTLTLPHILVLCVIAPKSMLSSQGCLMTVVDALSEPFATTPHLQFLQLLIILTMLYNAFLDSVGFLYLSSFSPFYVLQILLEVEARRAGVLAKGSTLKLCLVPAPGVSLTDKSVHFTFLPSFFQSFFSLPLELLACCVSFCVQRHLWAAHCWKPVQVGYLKNWTGLLWLWRNEHLFSHRTCAHGSFGRILFI